MPEGQKGKIGNSGANETFWDEHYQEQRYRQKDGTMLPLYDQVLTEEVCGKQRFEPSIGGLKLRKGDLPF